MLRRLAHMLISLGLAILVGLETVREANARHDFEKAERVKEALCGLLKTGVFSELLLFLASIVEWSARPTASQHTPQLKGSLDVLYAELYEWSQFDGQADPGSMKNGTNGAAHQRNGRATVKPYRIVLQRLRGAAHGKVENLLRPFGELRAAVTTAS